MSKERIYRMNKKQFDLINDYFLHTALHLVTLEENYLRQICASDVSLRELHVIEAVACLQNIGKNSMAEIARYLKLSPASLTTAVNVLVKKKYLVREYSPSDRRVIYVHLTERGEQTNERYLVFVKDMIREVGDVLDEQTADRLIEFIYKLSDYLEEKTQRK